MHDVESYSARQNGTLRQMTADGNQTETVEVEYAVNRSDRVVESRRTTTQGGQDVRVDRYVVEETLYQRSDQFVDQYGSEWIEQDIESFDRQWHLYDQLWRYQFILGNATLSTVEEERVDGAETYVVTADVDTEEFNTAIRDALGLPPGYEVGIGENVSLSATFWIDRTTNRPIKVQRTLSGTQTIQDETIDIERTITTQISYEPVTVSLPSGAEGARHVSSD